MKTVLCFGDSNTWGCVPFPHLGAAPVRLEKPRRWAQVMGRELGDNTEIVEEGLSGRTTVFDDPVEGDHKNGSRMLVGCLESHAPLDLVILMLGGNDFKTHINATAFTSARGTLTLIHMIKAFYVLSDDCPEILVVTPPAITTDAHPAFWGNAWQRCEGHADYNAQVAERTGCYHFDSNGVAAAGCDGAHFDAESHEALGRALAPLALQILGVERTL